MPGIVLLISALLALAEDLPPDLAKRSGEDWPGFMGPTGDGHSSATGIRTDWGDGLPVLWQMRCGAGYAAPSIARGRLLLFDRTGRSARLRCLEAESGNQIWQTTYPTDYEDMYGFSNGPRVAPLIDGSRVYTFGSEGMLRCQGVIDGELVWAIDTTERYGVVQNFFGVGASPAVWDDLLIVVVGGSPPDSPGVQSGETKGNGSGIVAFDKHTGREVYRLSDALAGYAMPRIIEHGGRAWAFAFMRGGLLAFEPVKGTRDFFFPWRARRIESVNAALPLIVDDRVLISESYGMGSALLRFSPGEVAVVRKDARRTISLGSHWATPIYVDGHIYGASGMGGGSDFRCVGFESGAVKWHQPGLRHANPIIADGHLLVTTEDGTLRLLEATPDAYREHAVMKGLVDRPTYNAPVLARGILYVLGNRKLVALELVPES